MDDTLRAVYEAVRDGQLETVAGAVQAALAAGLDPEAILQDGMIAAMAEVGRQFEAGECFIPEMMIAASAMQAGLAGLRPYLRPNATGEAGRVVIGTVKGDLHDIGKSLVAMMLEGAGFEVIDLGVDVEPAAFVEAVLRHQPSLVGLSALLTTTMVHCRTTLEALTAAGLRGQIKVMVGGAAVTETFAAKIGADGYAPDASRAVTLAKGLQAARRAG